MITMVFPIHPPSSPQKERTIPEGTRSLQVQQQASQKPWETPERTNEMLDGDGAVVAPPGYVAIQSAPAATGHQQPSAPQGIPLGCVPFQAMAKPGMDQFQAQAMQQQALFSAAAAAPPGYDPLQLRAQAVQQQQALLSAVAAAAPPGCDPRQLQDRAMQQQALFATAAAAPPGFDPFQAAASANPQSQLVASGIAQAQAMQLPTFPLLAAATAAPPGFDLVHAAAVAANPQAQMMVPVPAGYIFVPAAQQQPTVGYFPVQQGSHNQMFSNGDAARASSFSHGYIRFQSAEARAAQTQGMISSVDLNPRVHQGMNNTTQEQLMQQKLKEQQQHQEQQKLLATAAEQQPRVGEPSSGALPLQGLLPSSMNNEPTLVHSPHKSTQRPDPGTPQGESSKSKSSNVVRHVTPTFGHGYEYKELKDGSYLVRYADAGITSKWVEMQEPPI